MNFSSYIQILEIDYFVIWFVERRLLINCVFAFSSDQIHPHWHCRQERQPALLRQSAVRGGGGRKWGHPAHRPHRHGKGSRRMWVPTHAYIFIWYTSRRTACSLVCINHGSLGDCDTRKQTLFDLRRHLSSRRRRCREGDCAPVLHSISPQRRALIASKLILKPEQQHSARDENIKMNRIRIIHCCLRFSRQIIIIWWHRSFEPTTSC